MSKKLQVLVVFEFDGIDDPDSVEAEIAIDDVTHEIKRLTATDGLWDGAVTAWVQDATVVEEDK